MAELPVDVTAWQQEDGDWERWQLKGVDALKTGDEPSAGNAFAEALKIARQHFEPGDPRLASSLTSQAVMLSRKDDPLSKKLFKEALDHWDKIDAWLARQPRPKLARSSMFHLRLESKHPGGYPDEIRRICLSLADKARERTERLAAGGAVIGEALDQGWRPTPEKQFDVVRKVKSAACLMATG